MKRFILIIGLLLSLVPARAQAVDTMGDYTKKVLERADVGIAYARTGSAPLADWADLFLPWTKIAGSAMLSLIDTRLRIVAESRNLPEYTACLRTDLFLIEAKMKQVKEEIAKALDEKNLTAIFRLQNLLSFLNERFSILLEGSRNPKVIDGSWHERRLFEPKKKVWCCADTEDDQACAERETEECFGLGATSFATKEKCGKQTGCSVPAGPATPELCPFTTDYLPASVDIGYGCDIETISRLPAIITAAPAGGGTLRDAVGAEKDGMEKVLELLLEYTDLARVFADLEREIAELLGRPAPPSGIVPDPRRAHEKIEGCPIAWPADKDKDKDLWPDKAINVELYNAFTAERALREYELLRVFEEQRVEEAQSRTDPGYFLPDPARKTEGAGLDLLKKFGMESFERFSLKQGMFESQIFPQGSDAHKAVSLSLSVLTDAVRTLSHLARDIGSGKTKGLRGFVRDFAYFLRRSCLSRPCATRLDQVLRIVLKDECFPYTNGEYLNGKDYRDCKTAADLDSITP